MRHEHGEAKVTQQHLEVGVEQHILRLDIAVQEPLVMGVLQGGSHLLDIGHDCLERQTGAWGMPLAEIAMRSMLHH
jgi:hypothetical protein